MYTRLWYAEITLYIIDLPNETSAYTTNILVVLQNRSNNNA